MVGAPENGQPCYLAKHKHSMTVPLDEVRFNENERYCFSGSALSLRIPQARSLKCSRCFFLNSYNSVL